MKKEWFFWPLGPIFRKMGGVPVWRSKHTSMTDNLAEEAKKREFRSLHHPGGYPLAQPGMEEGILFHRPQGRHPYPTLRRGLREEGDTVHQDDHPFG